MKALIMIVLVLSSLTSFAGPEERRDAQVCYELTGKAPAVVPPQICVETVSVNLDKRQIEVYSYFYRKLLDGMNLSYLARHNENGFSFYANKMIASKSAGVCDEGAYTYLSMNGRTDNQGFVSPRELEISVYIEQYRDNCHSTPDVMTYTYKLQ